MIVFMRTKPETETLAEKLRARGLRAAAINGDIVQAQRERTVNQLKAGKLDILVATDVAARGLDVERISHVVNFDIPTDPESYVHRIGRTGRAGRSGEAISFVTPRERYLLKSIEKTTRQPLTPMQLPTVDDVNATRLARFDDAITAALSDAERVSFFRDVVDHYIQQPRRARGRRRRGAGDRRPGRDPAAARGGARAAPARARRASRPRRTAAPREPRRRGDGPPLATYRINVGKRHKVEPRQIVGALANEGNLSRRDFGAITIRPEFSLVELPAELPPGTEEALAGTRISGKLIELRRDTGPRRGPRPARDDDRPPRKARHRKG